MADPTVGTFAFKAYRAEWQGVLTAAGTEAHHG